MDAIPLIVIAGPTASGKTSLGISLASMLGGEIINVDSVQVYRHATIGSAKPTEQERALIPHHCVDIRDPDDPVDAASFATEARQAIADVFSRGRVPVVVAGTSLYLKTLLYGVADLPPANYAFRAGLSSIPTEELHTRLCQRDSLSGARIHKNDRIRIVRALEILDSTSESVSHQREGHGFRSSPYVPWIGVIWRPREELHRRIRQRVQEMLSRGLMEETELIASRYGEQAKPLETIGYRECHEVLRGTCSAAGLDERILFATRKLAKQQSTFWKNEPRKRGWIEFPHAEYTGAILVQDSEDRTVPDRRASLGLDELAAITREFMSSPGKTPQVWHIAPTSSFK